MPVVRAVPFAAHRLLAGLVSIGILALAMDHALAVPSMEGVGGLATAPLAPGHLVVSEVMTGGASASDEFIELYNPTATTLPLEGLEVVYVTATGATVTRKASWAAGAPGVPAGAHLLVANGTGIFAGVADVSYANGLAATGGSVALREIGASTAIDAVGWGTAASTWLETQPAPAPAAGSSLERLPGGLSGSGQDTDDNLLDFAVQPVPDPQNAGSAVIPGPSPSPGESASAVPTASPTPTTSTTPEPTAIPSSTQTPSISPTPTPTLAPTATATPTPNPTPVPMTIADARSQPDGTTVTVEGVSLTAADFTDGGGYLVDASAGIAVLVADGVFARGQRMRVSGTVDDRYAQRTIRATADTIVSLGTGSEPLPLDATTGSIDEALEGRLVEVSGVIGSGVTTLSTGLAWDVDDGTGAARVLVGTATGIDTSSWARGVGLTIVGVVGQRDSTGTGVSGFRIQPRDPSDVLSVEPAATPSQSPTPQPTATPAPSVTPSPAATPSADPLVSISEARAATTGTHLRVRGVVTAPSGLIEVGSAVVQDASGAILIRMGTDIGTLNLGQLVELDGSRATKAGMLSLRVSTAPQYLGNQADPEALRRASGAAGEAEEARLVIVRGAISSAITRARAGNVSFAVDDGSGPLRVTLSSRTGISTGSLTRGAWLELRGVLSQDTTGSAPASGYRLWPRIPADLRVLATSIAGTTAGSSCCPGSGSPQAGSPGTASGANGDQVVAQAAGRAPSLTRPRATGSPPLPTTGSGVAPTRDLAAPAGGLVVSGMGLAALAGLAAWFGRRRGPDDDQPTAEVAGVDAEAPEMAGPLGVPRLSVLRNEVADARKERRILPPT